MKKIALTCCICIASLIGTVEPTVAAADVKTYKNCTELNKVYKGGVSQSPSVKNKGGKTKYKPYASKELYEANKKSDRDNDLIACEK
jgi:hypothetical protein